MRATTHVGKLFLALTLSIGSAYASGMNSDKLRVSLAGLDLRTTAGVVAAQSRVQAGAREVCTWQDPSGAVASETYTDCVTQAIQEAAPQIRKLIARASLTASK